MNNADLLENYFSNLLIFLLKTAYPVYSTFKSINNNNGTIDTTWLIYWAIFAFFSFIESYFIQFVSWVPFFMICQVLFYIWLQAPFFNGSTIIFNTIVRKFFSGNQVVQSFLDMVKSVYNDLLSTVPQPIYDEDSSPSADISLYHNIK